jgi:hypothetical protein
MLPPGHLFVRAYVLVDDASSLVRSRCHVGHGRGSANR